MNDNQTLATRAHPAQARNDEGDLNMLDKLTQSLEKHLPLLAADREQCAPFSPHAAYLHGVRDTYNLETNELVNDEICIVVVDIDMPAELENALGPKAIPSLNQQVYKQISSIVRDDDVINYTPQGELMLSIHGGEKAAQQVARRVNALLDGLQLDLQLDD